MPELPEVETVVQDLNHSGILGLQITQTKIFWPKTIATFSQEDFIAAVCGQTIKKINRRAKFIVFELENVFMLIHLRMTGKLLLTSEKKELSSHERVLFTLSNGKELRFIDTRKFGRIYLSHDLNSFFEKYGPEPLSENFSWEHLYEILSKRSSQLKSLLLNQNVLAGLGNIYVDEALWLAKLHPLRKANTLTESEMIGLYHGIQNALKQGLLSKGATLGSGKTNFYRLDGSKGGFINKLNVFRQIGKKCPRCGNPIERIKAAGRSTHICVKCQKI